MGCNLANRSSPFILSSLGFDESVDVVLSKVCKSWRWSSGNCSIHLWRSNSTSFNLSWTFCKKSLIIDIISILLKLTPFPLSIIFFAVSNASDAIVTTFIGMGMGEVGIGKDFTSLIIVSNTLIILSAVFVVKSVVVINFILGWTSLR